MNKYTGVTRKKKEERDAKKKTGVEAAIASIAGQTQKFINEWSAKFNALGEQVNAIFKVATTEVGKIWANEQRIVESIDHLDINILAIAELQKDVYARQARHADLIKKLCEMAEVAPPVGEELAALNKAGAELYEEECKNSFNAVFERRKKEDAERKAAAEKAATDVKAAEEAKSEAERAEKALRDTERESLNDATSGGPGVEIPEGAQVFGGT